MRSSTGCCTRRTSCRWRGNSSVNRRKGENPVFDGIKAPGILSNVDLEKSFARSSHFIKFRAPLKTGLLKIYFRWNQRLSILIDVDDAIIRSKNEGDGAGCAEQLYAMVPPDLRRRCLRWRFLLGQVAMRALKTLKTHPRSFPASRFSALRSLATPCCPPQSLRAQFPPLQAPRVKCPTCSARWRPSPRLTVNAATPWCASPCPSRTSPAAWCACRCSRAVSAKLPSKKYAL